MARLEDMTEDEQDALRDRFAMAALQVVYDRDSSRVFREEAEFAFLLADAMLEARDKAKGGPSDG